MNEVEMVLRYAIASVCLHTEPNALPSPFIFRIALRHCPAEAHT